MGENSVHYEISFSAPFVFIMVTAFKLLSKWIENMKKARRVFNDIQNKIVASCNAIVGNMACIE